MIFHMVDATYLQNNLMAQYDDSSATLITEVQQLTEIVN